MDFIQELFPQIPPVFIEIVVNDSGGDLDLAIDYLTDLDRNVPPELFDSGGNGRTEGKPEASGQTRKDESLDDATKVSFYDLK